MELRRLVIRFLVVVLVMFFMALSSLTFARQMFVRHAEIGASAPAEAVTYGS